MRTTMIDYLGIHLEVSSFLVENDLWPINLPLDAWPTFCGAGEGIGDFIVPDKIFGVSIAPACFQHDLDFSLGNRNWLHFLAANRRLRQNIKAIANAHLPWSKRIAAHVIADTYWEAVMAAGYNFFNPDSTESTWMHSPTVKSKLHRLAMNNLHFEA